MKVIFPAKRLAETRNLQFDFTSLLAAGETISSATVTASVYSGVDPSPSAILAGSPVVSTPIVTQSVTGGVLGTIYQLVAIAVTSAGQNLALQGFLAIQLDAT